MAKGAPQCIYPDGYRLRDKLLDSVERWRQHLGTTPNDNDRNACPRAMMEKFNLQDANGWDMRAVAASDLGLIWAYVFPFCTYCNELKILGQIRIPCLHYTGSIWKYFAQ